MDEPTRNDDGWKFLAAINRVGVAKRLSVRSPAGRTRTLIDATTVRSDKEWRRVLRRDPCAYCGGAGGTIDHITPMALGGAKGSTGNWTGVCPKCNAERGPRGLIYFLAGAEDPTPGERVDAIKRIRRARNYNIGPEIRTALAGVGDKEARRQIAGAIMRRHRAGRADRKRQWLRRMKQLHRELVGGGQASSDDPTSMQHRRNARFGRLNDPAATDGGNPTGGDSAAPEGPADQRGPGRPEPPRQRIFNKAG